MTQADLETFATIAAGLFSGALVYIQMSMGPVLMARVSGPGPRHSGRLAGLWVVSTGFAAAAGALWSAWLGAGLAWLVGGLTYLALVTLVVYLNGLVDTLREPWFEEDPLDDSQLVRRWTRWHGAAATIGVAVFALLVVMREVAKTEGARGAR